MRFRQHQDQARAATRRLLLLFLLTVALTVAAVNGVLALLWLLQTGGVFDYPRWFFETNSVVATGFILGGSWLETVQLRKGGAHVAQMVGARELLVPRDAHEQRLRNIVEEMAIATGLRPPRIFLLPRDDGINAFAAGWEQQDSVVAVTRGALERLERDELQGVVAHEFSHILHGDARLNMRLIGHVWGLQLLFMLGRDLFDSSGARGRRSVFVLMGLGLMGVGSIGWLAGRLLKAAVSRQREFLADAAAVQFTRLPGGIGGALRKIAGQDPAAASALHSSRAEVVSHMLFDSGIFSGRALATHPPLAERIRRVFGRPMPPVASAVLVVAQSGPDAAPLPFEAVAFGAPNGADQAAVVAGETSMQVDGAVKPEAVADADAGAVPYADTDARAAAWLDDMLDIAWPHDLAPVTLAFLVTTGGSDEEQTWRQEFSELGQPRQDHLLGQVAQMRAGWLQVGYERLLSRCASLDRAQRGQMRRQAHRIVKADGRVSRPEWWRCLVLDHLLELRHESVLRETHCLTLAQCGPAIAHISAVLAGALHQGRPDSASAQSSWCQAVLEQLDLGDRPDAGVPPHRSASRAMRQLSMLSWSSRPRLMKVWCALALHADVAASQELCDALRSVCLLIDTPVPPDLQLRYPGALRGATQA